MARVAGDVVGRFHFGEVLRPHEARAPHELVLANGDPLVCGPSFVKLLERFPDGALPDETVAAIRALLLLGTSPQHLRYDIEARTFKSTEPPHTNRIRGDELARRLLALEDGAVRPRYDKLFRPAAMPAPEGHAHAQDAGAAHLAGIVEACCDDLIREACAWREECFMASTAAPVTPQQTGVTTSENKRTAERLFDDVVHDTLLGRVGTARMNLKLASIYDPGNERYVRGLASLPVAR